MMKINLLCHACILYCMISISYAQSQEDQVMKVGDVFKSTKTMKTLTGEFDLKTLKADLLILDFFMTNCTACIEAFPKNNLLQLEFGNRIKILPVSPESKVVVKSFFKQNSYTQRNQLDVVVEDNVFKHLFPHQGYPHLVWIYKGRVIAITPGDMLSKKWIAHVLEGRSTAEWPMKNDFEELQFFEGDADLSSKLTAYKNGIPTGFHRDTIGDKVYYKMSNVSILPALLYAYSKLRKLPLMKKERVRLIGLPPSDVFDQQAESKSLWLKDHGFCYESFWPLAWTEEERMKAVAVDLSNRMRLDVSFGQDKAKIWLVKKTAATATATTNNGGMAINIACVLLEINNPDFPPIVLETTHTNDKVKLDAVTDFDSLQKSLQKVGYEVSEEYRDIDKIILKSTVQ